jgi:hypothetical protein
LILSRRQQLVQVGIVSGDPLLQLSGEVKLTPLVPCDNVAGVEDDAQGDAAKHITVRLGGESIKAEKWKALWEPRVIYINGTAYIDLLYNLLQRTRVTSEDQRHDPRGE